MIALEEVRARLAYDPATGVLTWKDPVPPKARRNLGVAGTRDSDGYVVVRLNGRGYKAHRLAWLLTYGAWPEGLLDHRNHDRADNRLDNLREATPLLNAQHLDPRKVRARSGVRGVSWFSQYGKWKASFNHNKVHYFVGHYDTVEEAAKALAERRVSVCLPSVDS